MGELVRNEVEVRSPGVLGRWWVGLRWYVRGVLGGSAYDGYLAWHSRHGAGDPLSERAYWRHRTAHQEAHPEGRCC